MLRRGQVAEAVCDIIDCVAAQHGQRIHMHAPQHGSYMFHPLQHAQHHHELAHNSDIRRTSFPSRSSFSYVPCPRCVPAYPSLLCALRFSAVVHLLLGLCMRACMRTEDHRALTSSVNAEASPPAVAAAVEEEEEGVGGKRRRQRAEVAARPLGRAREPTRVRRRARATRRGRGPGMRRRRRGMSTGRSCRRRITITTSRPMPTHGMRLLTFGSQRSACGLAALLVVWH